MNQLAEEEKFEMAAKIRDSIQSIKVILQKQAVINESVEKDLDVFTYYGDERGCIIETLHFRSGGIIGNRSQFLDVNPIDTMEDEREWFVSFINQYYEENIVPDEVLVGADFGGEINKLLENVLEFRTARKIPVRFPTDEKGRKLLEMCKQNAIAHLEKRLSENEEKFVGVDEIKNKMELLARPHRIECYVIYNFQGTETVASQVVFEDGLPAKHHYRRYKIKTVEGQNDFAAMYEVLFLYP